MSNMYDTTHTVMHAVCRNDGTAGVSFHVVTYHSIEEPTPPNAVFAYLDKGRADAKAAELNWLKEAAV